MSTIITIIITIITLGVMIFVHELGHFLAAKSMGIQVNEFALGFGPTIFKFTKGETTYALRALPFGGYVNMEGENEESENERAFNRKRRWPRVFVLSAGAVMNLLLGFLIVILLVVPFIPLASATVAKFSDDATSNAVLREGDTILRINGSRIRIGDDIFIALFHTGGNPVNMTVDRNGEIKEFVVPLKVEETDGITMPVRDFYIYTAPKTFLSSIRYSFFYTIVNVKLVWISLTGLVTGRFPVTQMSGPVGIVNAIGQARAVGWPNLFMLISMITVNLGIFNLLPVPGLDGGRLLFILVEAVRGKPVPAKYEAYVHAAGIILLIGFMVFITYNDIVKSDWFISFWTRITGG